MNITTISLLMLAVMTLDPPGVHAADPGAKPRLAPRPVPGLAKSPSKQPAKSGSAMTHVAKPSSPSPSAPAVEQARILTVYRAGTFAVPDKDAAPAAGPAPAPSGESANTFTAPRPGHIRVITEAEARALVSEP